MDTPRTFTEHAAMLAPQVASGAITRDDAVARLRDDILGRGMDYVAELAAAEAGRILDAAAPLAKP